MIVVDCRWDESGNFHVEDADGSKHVFFDAIVTGVEVKYGEGDRVVVQTDMSTFGPVIPLDVEEDK